MRLNMTKLKAVATTCVALNIVCVSASAMELDRKYICVPEDAQWTSFREANAVGILNNAPRSIQLEIRDCGSNPACSSSAFTHLLELQFDQSGERIEQFFVGNFRQDAGAEGSFVSPWNGEVRIDGLRFERAYIGDIRNSSGGIEPSVSLYSGSCFASD